MDGIELFLLGRTLMKIGEEAMPTDTGGVRPVLIVVADLRAHEVTSVGEITTRTGLPQSAVSAAVARLREVGAVVTEPDPRDRRRQLIRHAPTLPERVTEVRATPIDSALAAALGTDDEAEVAELVAELERLARRLTPKSLSRLRAAEG